MRRQKSHSNSLESMISVYREDVDRLNQLVRNSDESRSNASTLFLTVYGAATSALFVYTLNGRTDAFDHIQKIYLFATILTSLLIVFTSLIEKSFDYIARVQVAKEHIRQIKEQSTVANGKSHSVIAPKMLVQILLKFIPLLQLILIALNTIFIALSVFRIIFI